MKKGKKWGWHEGWYSKERKQQLKERKQFWQKFQMFDCGAMMSSPRY
jgi:hypothetical protein